jgi:hypothetical protein
VGSHPRGRCCCRHRLAQCLDDAPGRNVLATIEHDVEHLVMLIAIGVRVGVAVDNLQRPHGVLVLHLLFLFSLWVNLLFALPLGGECTVLAWRLLLHLLT